MILIRCYYQCSKIALLSSDKIKKIKIRQLIHANLNIFFFFGLNDGALIKGRWMFSMFQSIMLTYMYVLVLRSGMV